MIRPFKQKQTVKTAPALDLPEFMEAKHNPRAKRMSLRLDIKTQKFIITLPTRHSTRRAQDFIDTHYDWMRKELSKLPQKQYFTDGAIIPILGKKYRIKVHKTNAKRTTITMEDGILHVHTNQADPALRIKRFLKELAKEELTRLSHEKATWIRKKVASVSVRDTTSRWGSCSAKGNLSYSWRLIFAPYESLDYVVAHEVAHLKHLDHSKKFWNLCEELSDNYVAGKGWMKSHAHTLLSWGELGK